MRLYFLALLLLLQGTAKGENAPKVGASYFDYLLEELDIKYDGRRLNGKTHPFPSLLKKLNTTSPFFTAIIPFGRSLQKMAAYPQALKFPRVLVATRSDKKGMNRHMDGRLFIAYVEPSKKLEVISYNPVAARYEFQIVDQFFHGGAPQIKYADRKLCLRCHQGGVPIFADGDWLEATAFNHELRTLTKKAMGRDHYWGIPLSREGVSKEFDLLPRPERFDDMTHAGAMLIAHQRAWQKICAHPSAPRQCRQELLSWMILTNVSDKGMPHVSPALLEAFRASIGDGTIDIPDDHIPDYNPLKDGKLDYQLPAKYDPTRPRKPMVIMVPSQNDSLDILYQKFLTFSRSMGKSIFTQQDFDILKLFMEPWENKTLSIREWRSRNNYQSNSKEWCVLENPELAKTFIYQNESSKVKASCQTRGLRGLFNGIYALKLPRDRPLIRTDILHSLDKSMKTSHWSNLCCHKTIAYKAKKEKRLSRLNSVDITSKDLKPFFKYCSECHLYQDLPMPFLAGNSELEIKTQIKIRRELIMLRLKTKQMPPHFARLQISAKERRELLKLLKKM